MRDRIVVWLANRVLSLASQSYRTRLKAVLLSGFKAAQQESNPPFTEPLVDAPQDQEGE